MRPAIHNAFKLCTKGKLAAEKMETVTVLAVRDKFTIVDNKASQDEPAVISSLIHMFNVVRDELEKRTDMKEFHEKAKVMADIITQLKDFDDKIKKEFINPELDFDKYADLFIDLQNLLKHILKQTEEFEHIIEFHLQGYEEQSRAFLERISFLKDLEKEVGLIE